MHIERTIKNRPFGAVFYCPGLKEASTDFDTNLDVRCRRIEAARGNGLSLDGFGANRSISHDRNPVMVKNWSGRRESNPHRRLGRRLHYHYATPALPLIWHTNRKASSGLFGRMNFNFLESYQE